MTQQRHEIGYVKLIQGQWSDDARNLAVADVAPARGRTGGRLYILVELSGDTPGREELAERLTGVARQAYLTSAGSFTLGLRRAIEAANASLFQANLDVPVDKRRYGGISCVVVSDYDVYIGQAGPAVVYALHGEGVRRFPSESSWLPAPGATPGEPPSLEPDMVDGSTWVPLGVRRSLEVNFAHCRIEPGDTVCLATSNLAQLVRQDDMELILDQEPEDSLRDLLTVGEGQDLTVLLVQTPSLAEPEEREREVAVSVERARASGPGWLARAGQALGRVNLRGWLWGIVLAVADLLARFLPDRKAQPLPPVAEDQKQRLLAGIAVLIPLLIAVLTLVLYLRQVGQFDVLMDQARQDMALAQGADELTGESLLRNAAVRIENALQIRPDDGEVRRLKAEVDMALEQVQGLTRLADLQPVLEFSPSSRLKRVWGEQDNLYVLDLGQQQVLRIPLVRLTDERPRVVLMQGQVLDGRTVSELVDMTWVSPQAGAAGHVAVLARDGVLWMLEPEGAVGRPLPGAETWGQPVALGAFEGNAYVLDAGRDQIWKYVPALASPPGQGGAGYTAPVVAWLESPISLESAVDMAIDGAIYVLEADGTIRKFAASRRIGFALQGMDRPFKDPLALFTTPQTAALYVVDPGNRRIVELSKDGAFRRQWLAPLASHALDELSGLFVDQSGRRVYVLSGQRLYVATLP